MENREIIWKKNTDGEWECRIDKLVCYSQCFVLGNVAIWSETDREKSSMVGAFRVKHLNN